MWHSQTFRLAMEQMGKRASTTHRAKHAGQALVEFGLVVTLLTLLVALAVDVGRVYAAWIDLGNMARAGAQRGTIAAYLGDPDPAAAMVAAAEAEQPTIYGRAATVTAAWLPEGRCAARVTVSYQLQPILPLGVLFGGSLPSLQRSAEMRVLFLPPGTTCS